MLEGLAAVKAERELVMLYDPRVGVPLTVGDNFKSGKRKITLQTRGLLTAFQKQPTFGPRATKLSILTVI
jgi:hypothetical protein